jgi:histone-arginine methyltransferase CARM1
MSAKGHMGLKCEDHAQLKSFSDELSKRRADYERFEQYEQNSVQSYFQYYAKLTNQQNMLQDGVRTSTYRRAIVENPADFQGKTALDLGAGSGILSFFSVQAGAEKVYAVEASSMGEVVRSLADGNSFLGPKVVVVNRPLETITNEVADKVDVLVSEPIGTFLFNERMIESYLVARDRFLKPGGKMFPNVGTLCVAPFSDAMLHYEQSNKDVFWKNTDFYGIDLTPAVPRCAKEHFRQPVVDYINPECLVSKQVEKRFDFATVSVEALQTIDMPFEFAISQPCLVHGLAGWFDAYFEGTNQTVLLSTAPWCPGTHWYQIRFLLEVPLAVNAGQIIEGSLKMEANNLQSYYLKLSMRIKGTDISSENPCIDLKDPEYRFYTSQHTYVPPGTGAPAAVQQQAQQTGQVMPCTPQQSQQQYQQAHFAQSQSAAFAAAAAPQQMEQGA